ncbi:MAG: copper chaperone PCu(A)C [Nocardioidaceae bacterium]|nr:MAG: copper chaperone PCu(A)C [Nocardioidaceae bacterium]
MRATAGSTDPTMTAAFMVLYNEGSTDIALTGATADVADMTELHEMVKVDGKEMMQQVEEGITITAGRGKELAPGGYHVMMMGLNTDLAPGDEVTFTLTFSDGTEQTVHAPVKEFTEEEGHYHEPGTGEHSHDDEDS